MVETADPERELATRAERRRSTYLRAGRGLGSTQPESHGDARWCTRSQCGSTRATAWPALTTQSASSSQQNSLADRPRLNHTSTWSKPDPYHLLNQTFLCKIVCTSLQRPSIKRPQQPQFLSREGLKFSLGHKKPTKESLKSCA
jgi:hypothetical protein